MIRDLGNRNRINNETYPFKEDFVEIVKVNSNKTVDVRLSSRAGHYLNCFLFEGYTPQIGEKAIIYFIGGGQIPMVMPLKPADNLGDIPTNNEGDISTHSLREGSMQGMVNLYDALKLNPAYNAWVTPVSSRESSWGVPDWINVLLKSGKALYEATSNKLTINDIYNLPNHTGKGHYEGTGADGGSTPDGLDVVSNLTEANKTKVIAALNAFFNSGVKGIIWGLVWHSNQKLAREVAEPFGYKLWWQTTDKKGKGDSKHIHHWHLSFRPRETGF